MKSAFSWITKSYGTNMAVFGNGYAMLTLWLAIAAMSAIIPTKQMFVG